MPLLHSNGMAVGTPAPDFSLPGVDGKSHGLADFADAPALVVVFTCNHCPYAIAAEDRLVELANQFEGKAAFVAINPNDAARYPADDFASMQKRAAEKAFPFPYLHDETQEVARAYDAACTPDLFVFDSKRELVYNGRLDDNWQDPSAVKHEDLRAVLEATVEGKPHGLAEVVPSMGCSIKWKP